MLIGMVAMVVMVALLVDIRTTDWHGGDGDGIDVDDDSASHGDNISDDCYFEGEHGDVSRLSLGDQSSPSASPSWFTIRRLRYTRSILSTAILADFRSGTITHHQHRHHHSQSSVCDTLAALCRGSGDPLNAMHPL